VRKTGKGLQNEAEEQTWKAFKNRPEKQFQVVQANMKVIELPIRDFKFLDQDYKPFNFTQYAMTNDFTNVLPILPCIGSKSKGVNPYEKCSIGIDVSESIEDAILKELQIESQDHAFENKYEKGELLGRGGFGAVYKVKSKDQSYSGPGLVAKIMNLNSRGVEYKESLRKAFVEEVSYNLLIFHSKFRLKPSLSVITYTL
jgi:hypothetical protein